jgi:hypothetical protein
MVAHRLGVDTTWKSSADLGDLAAGTAANTETAAAVKTGV